MSEDEALVVSAMAINVTIPEALRWTDTRRGQEFRLDTLNVRMLPDGHLAAKAYGRPVEGGRGAYVSFTVPDRPELAALVTSAADRAAERWAGHQGLG
ncbi:hypothetical protein FHX52_1311 [Humibacillus xanthopallidus]|uniref:Uncharacterized protein n=1 Tax=Humibacillus xanthopallidus TaxID=412689 RepID=A0A543PVV1_9MICO|nr:hypothetical protein [Humibacillus xanthopallidus]TQN48186.1 hypothetical protein FHX52_1311 [Humibacillus xanthopallidus]